MTSCKRTLRPRPLPSVLALLTLFVLAANGPALGDPTPGFRETWPGTSVQGWGGGAGSPGLVLSNPGTGGAGGDGDGFLVMSRLDPPSNFGARSSGPEYLGNWQAAGISQVRVWLDDVNTDEPFEVHFSIGGFNNLWQYNQGFFPPLQQWSEFIVDLTDSTTFTHTIALDGKGFQFALQNVEVVHLRHDLAPYMQFPDPIAGDLGVDNLLLTNGVVGVPPGLPVIAHPVELAAPYPNPSRGPVALAVETREPLAVRLEILDVQGRLVRRAELPGVASGARTWMWDGRDDGGRQVPPGSYQVRALSASGGTSRRLVRID